MTVIEHWYSGSQSVTASKQHFPLGYFPSYNMLLLSVVFNYTLYRPCNGSIQFLRQRDWPSVRNSYQEYNCCERTHIYLYVYECTYAAEAHHTREETTVHVRDREMAKKSTGRQQPAKIHLPFLPRHAPVHPHLCWAQPFWPLFKSPWKMCPKSRGNFLLSYLRSFRVCWWLYFTAAS